jgi:hypothetical protein
MSAPITITGNLVADPELKFTQNAKALATFTVVSSKSSRSLMALGKIPIQLFGTSRHGARQPKMLQMHFARELPSSSQAQQFKNLGKIRTQGLSVQRLRLQHGA